MSKEAAAGKDAAESKLAAYDDLSAQIVRLTAEQQVHIRALSIYIHRPMSIYIHVYDALTAAIVAMMCSCQVLFRTPDKY
jgi:hypothetical protein